MMTHKDRLFVLSFITSPYQNVSTAELPYNESYVNKHSPQRPYYDTHLVERFRPEMDDFESNENSYEKIEMDDFHHNNNNKNENDENFDSDDEDNDDTDIDENVEESDEVYIPPTTISTAHVTQPTFPSVPRIESTSKMKPTKTPLPTLKSIQITTSTTSTTTTTEIPLTSVTVSKKNKSKSNISSNQKNQNNRHQNNGHKKQNHRNHDNKGHSSANESNNNNKRRKEFIINHESDDEIDDHLELKPERDYNFDFDDVIATKSIDFQKPILPQLPTQSLSISPSSQPTLASSAIASPSSNRKSNSKKSSQRGIQNPTKESETRTSKESNIKNNQTPSPPPTIQSTSVSTSADSKIIEIKSTPKNTISAASNVRKTRSYQHEIAVNEDDFIVRSITPPGSGGATLVISDDGDNNDEDIEYLRENRERILESGEDVDGNFMVIEPSALIGSTQNGNASIRSHNRKLSSFGRFLQSFLHMKDFDVTQWTTPPSLEFLNFALAIIVWSVRYPSVFWRTSKSFAAVFSLQLIVNGLDILVGFAGMSVLYKIQISNQMLPLNSPTLILNAVVTISLYLFSSLLIIASSMILYLYGHGRLAAKIRDRSTITIKSDDYWINFAHCASLAFVLALAVVKAPLMNDLCAAYRGSLDGAVLAAGNNFKS